MNALPAPYMVRREFDRMGATLAQQSRRYTSEDMAQQHEAGRREGWCEAILWLARNTGALILFGVCVGVTLAVVCAPMLSFILGV